MPPGDASLSRVIVYVDGFNFYFGMRSKGWRQFYWLNLHLLSQNLLRPDQVLVGTKYFTARISGPKPTDSHAKKAAQANKRKRQSTFLEAVGTESDVSIYYGQFLSKSAECFGCKNKWETYEEKMTDVQIATEMLTDSFENRFDTAILISGDSDLVPPVRSIRRLFPEKRIVAAFPPDRVSVQLKGVVSGSFVIGHGKLAASQFPDSLTKADGHQLTRPSHWR